MKVLFAPIFKGNTYQERLMKELEMRDKVLVIRGQNGQTPFFKDPVLPKVDIIHFHWFDPYVLYKKPFKQVVKMISFLFRLRRLKGSKTLIWTAHNLKSHDSKYPKMEKWFLKSFVRLLDGISVHNNFTKNTLVNAYGVDPRKIEIIPHPNYIGVYPEADSEKVFLLKEKLGISKDDFVFMLLGQIRPYKGAIEAIKAFKLAKMPHAKLLICGEVKGDDSYILEQIDFDPNILFQPNFVDDKDISTYIALADVMLYPYRDILTSGAMILGMSFKKPCLSSRVGSMPEFLDDRFLFSDIVEFSKKMEKIYLKQSQELRTIGLKNYSRIERDSWENMASLTVQLYVKSLIS